MVMFNSSSSGKFGSDALSPAASSDMRQQADTAGTFSFQGQQQQALRHSSSAIAASPADDHLFTTPTDLVSVIAGI